RLEQRFSNARPGDFRQGRQRPMMISLPMRHGVRIELATRLQGLPKPVDKSHGNDVAKKHEHVGHGGISYPTEKL
ncbi:MAG: hypothetical protein ACREFD_19465, partial [Stellaceae bacterium]